MDYLNVYASTFDLDLSNWHISFLNLFIVILDFISKAISG